MEWWSGTEAGIVGGVGGSLVGLFGAIVGTLSGLLIPKGKGRSFLLTLVVVLAGVGIVVDVVGLVAIAQGQPYHVWYPFILMGPMMTVLFGVGFFVLRHRYEQVELERMKNRNMAEGV